MKSVLFKETMMIIELQISVYFFDHLGNAGLFQKYSWVIHIGTEVTIGMITPAVSHESDPVSETPQKQLK